MAAAGAGASILETVMILRGAESAAREIRETAGHFDHLRENVDRANDAIASIRNNQIFSGGPAAQVGALAAAFETAGLSAERLATVAHELRERLYRDPITIGAFGRSVLTARLGGPQDETQVLDEAIRMLRETRDAEERLYLARKLQIEALLPLADLDTKHLEALRQEGKIKGALVDEELRRLRATEDAQFQRMKDLREERDLQVQRIQMRSGNWMREHVWLPLNELLTHGAFRTGARAPAASSRAAGGMEGLADELSRNTRALANLRDELANSGPRGRAAIPGAYGVGGGQNLQQALQTGKLALGAFIP